MRGLWLGIRARAERFDGQNLKPNNLGATLDVK